MERNTGNLNEIDKSIEKVEKIRNDIEGTDIVLEKLKLLQNNFGYIVSALLRLRKQGKVLGRIVSSSESGSFKGIDHDLFGGWLGRQSFFKIKDPASLKGLNKSCLAAKLLSFPVDDMRFKNDHPTDNTIAECKDLAEKLIIILSEFITSIQDYKDKVKKESEKRKLRNKLCQLLYEIFLDCKISINNYLKVAEELHGAQSRFDGIVNNMADVNKCFEEFFSTKDPQKKECNLKELVEVNKKRSLQELFTPNEVNRHIPVAFIFSNKNSILEWAFYCLYSNPTLKVDDVPKFIDACVKEEKLLPDGWIFSHKLKFLKLNGKPIPGATTSGTKILNLISLLKKKFNGFSYLIVNFNERIISYSANKDHKFGEAGLRFLKIKNPDVKDMCDLCNKVELVFNGDMNIETDILEEDKGDPSCCYKEFFSTKDAKEKRNYLVKLVEINKEKSLSELIPKAEVEEHIPLVFFFDNKNSVMEWGFYCLYSNPSLRPENIEKFLRDCLQKKEFLPPGWILLHELEFLKANGGPIPGATNSDAKILAVVSKVREKFGTLSYAEISFRKEIELKINGKSIKKLFDANRNYKFGSTKLQLLKIKNPSIKTLPDSCNKVDLIFKGGAPMKMEVPEVTEEISEIKKSKLKLADKIKSKFKKGKKETSE